ncbi:MAG: FtsX-like permease family protein [Vicinamibacterales bacterium]
MRRIVRELDPSRAVVGIAPLEDTLDAALERPRLDSAALLAFAIAALGLAAVGQYSLFMLVVGERTRELALRQALGAAPAQVVRLVARDAGGQLAAGLALGVVLTMATGQVWQALLTETGPTDPVALVVAAIVLVVASTLAVSRPALAAARVAPVEALKES